MRASTLTAVEIDRYIEARLAEDYAPASVNRQTGLLAEALRLAHRRGTLTSVIAIRRLPGIPHGGYVCGAPAPAAHDGQRP